MLQPNGQYQWKRLTATGYIKIDQGLLGGFLVASGSGSVTIYDSTSKAGGPATTSGAIILNTMTIADATPYPLPVLFNYGCYVVISGTMDVTFFYN